MNKDLLYIGKILSSHGLKGCVKIQSYTHNPMDIFKYKNIVDESGRVYEISLYGKTTPPNLISCVKGISVKEEADKLKNTKLYISKKDLPSLNDGDFYVSDLIGYVVKDENSDIIGTVSNILNYGASDIIEITTQNETKKLLSFNDNSVLNVDLEKKEITIDEQHLL